MPKLPAFGCLLPVRVPVAATGAIGARLPVVLPQRPPLWLALHCGRLTTNCLRLASFPSRPPPLLAGGRVPQIPNCLPVRPLVGQLWVESSVQQERRANFARCSNRRCWHLMPSWWWWCELVGERQAVKGLNVRPIMR